MAPSIKKDLEMDSFSYCSMLVDILQFVDYTDIANCKLVNRKINEVIQKNILSMPRKVEDLLIWSYGDKRYLRVSVFDSSKNIVFITDDRTILFQNKPSTLEYYKNIAIPFVACPGSRSEDIIKEISASYFENEEDVASCVSYANKNLDEGLRVLLSFLFRRYYFNRVFLVNFPEELQPMFLDEFRQNRSRCRTLLVSKVMNSTNHLSQMLGCSTLQTYSSNNNEILDVVNWNRRMTLQLLIQSNCAKRLHNIIKLLLSGKLSLQKVELQICRYFDKDDFVNDLSMDDDSAKYAALIIQQAIDEVKENWDELKGQWKTKSFSKSINIERSCDNTVFVLYVSYSGFYTFEITIKQLN